MSNQQSPLSGQPIIFGEVLFDQFPDGESVLGGAPFNVAWHLKGLGADPLFISRVGKDDAGEKVRRAMRDWGMNDGGLQEDPGYPTGAVQITLEDGQHSFDILPNQAYDHVDATDVGSVIDTTPNAVGKGGLLYHGSLILRTAAMGEVLEALLAKTQLPIFVDVNLRAPWWKESELITILERARWAKVNDEELAIIAYILDQRGSDLTETARQVQRICNMELLIVTRGSEGAMALDQSGQILSVVPTSDIKVVDTVGAGDAFSAIVIMGILAGWPLADMMRRAQEFAGRVCGIRGAISTDPGFYGSMGIWK